VIASNLNLDLIFRDGMNYSCILKNIFQLSNQISNKKCKKQLESQDKRITVLIVYISSEKYLQLFLENCYKFILNPNLSSDSEMNMANLGAGI
jgi:hypothetical protein